MEKGINLSERIISLLAFYEKFLFWAELQSRIVARPHENGRDEVLFSFPFRFVQHKNKISCSKNSSFDSLLSHHPLSLQSINNILGVCVCAYSFWMGFRFTSVSYLKMDLKPKHQSPTTFCHVRMTQCRHVDSRSLDHYVQTKFQKLRFSLCEKKKNEKSRKRRGKNKLGKVENAWACESWWKRVPDHVALKKHKYEGKKVERNKKITNTERMK